MPKGIELNDTVAIKEEDLCSLGRSVTLLGRPDSPPRVDLHTRSVNFHARNGPRHATMYAARIGF